jgi:CRISPR/Cas system-associated endoribonuclease Cas2
MVVEFAKDIKKRVARHWRLTEVIENKILNELQNSVIEAKSLEQILRVLQENIRLQRLILGEPDMISQEGPKSPYEAFLAKMQDSGKIQEAEVGEITEKIENAEADPE